MLTGLLNFKTGGHHTMRDNKEGLEEWSVLARLLAMLGLCIHGECEIEMGEAGATDRAGYTQSFRDILIVVEEVRDAGAKHQTVGRAPSETPSNRRRTVE
jgi:hypothetical protein